MQKYVSGAIGFYVPYKNEQKLYLPDIQELKGKKIKYIDVVPLTLAADETVLIGNYANYSLYFNLMEKDTNDFQIKDMPIAEFNIEINKGNKYFIDKVIDFPNSYIANYSSVAATGQAIFCVAWYDEPAVMQNVPSMKKLDYDTFEVVATDATNGLFLFDENRTLYNRNFRNIVFPFYGSANTTPRGNTATAETNAFLTLQKHNLAYIRNVPVRCFYQLTDCYRMRLQNITFDFTNSYVKVAPSLVSAVKGKSFFFTAEFEE